jgi:hypothetical protein
MQEEASGMYEMVDSSNAAAKAATLARHRAAFDLWLLVHCPLEEGVVRRRILKSAFERALDLLFIQAFKSHSSLYPLCVLGHCEDAAMIARRIFEVALQVAYLNAEDAERETRGRQYLAYFFHLVPNGILNDPSLTPEAKHEWQQLYDQAKPWLKFDRKGRPSLSWSGLSIADLARRLGLHEAYDRDYRFLSNIVHVSSAGSMLRMIDGVVQITDDSNVTPILVHGTRYVLAVLEVCNAHFKLISDGELDELNKAALSFKL